MQLSMKSSGGSHLLLRLGVIAAFALIVRGAVALPDGAPRASNRVNRLQRQTIATGELASGLTGTGTSFNSLYGGSGADINPYEQQSTYGAEGGLYGGRGYGGTGGYGGYGGYGAAGYGGLGGGGYGGVGGYGRGHNSAGGGWRGFGRGGYGRGQSSYGGVKY